MRNWYKTLVAFDERGCLGDGTVFPASMPEPPTAALLALGLLGVIFFMRRRLIA
jgi:hypothetical protein